MKKYFFIVAFILTTFSLSATDWTSDSYEYEGLQYQRQYAFIDADIFLFRIFKKPATLVAYYVTSEAEETFLFHLNYNDELTTNDSDEDQVFNFEIKGYDEEIQGVRSPGFAEIRLDPQSTVHLMNALKNGNETKIILHPSYAKSLRIRLRMKKDNLQL
ncbi:MAG: hypothetical protein MI717_04340 [Spirochaetales bacterium]|nr:hypothetical protein [Spirochaetales bacterium]